MMRVGNVGHKMRGQVKSFWAELISVVIGAMRCDHHASGNAVINIFNPFRCFRSDWGNTL